MSIRWKLTIMFITLVFIVMMVTGTFIIMSLRFEEEGERAADLAARAQAIRTNVIDAAPNSPLFDPNAERSDFEGLLADGFAEVVTGEIPSYMEAFLIVGDNRVTLASTTGSFDLHIGQVVISALSGQSMFLPPWQANNLAEETPWFEYAMPVFLDGSTQPDFVIYVRSDGTSFDESLRNTTYTIGFGALVAITIASVLALIFSSSLTQNLLRLNRRIKEFKVGASGDPIFLGSVRDEIGQLSESFSTMANNLGQTMAAVTNEKNKMEIIMYSMSDGVLAYDENGTLIHSNYACEELLGIENIGRMNMYELFAEIGIDFPEGKSIDNMEDSIINVGDKYVNANFNPYKSEEDQIQGVIIVFQDITKHMLLDNMRKDFVANVSHEIRTPLTTIKSYAETLLDGAAEDANLRDEFLSVINNEADRMASIVKDLLELSRFDSSRMEFDFKTTDLVALVAANVRQHKISGEKTGKEIAFINNLDTANVYIDPERINQVLDNIITNAFRYSGDNAKTEVEIRESRLFYMVYITDNGIGIPKEDLRMVFERFYRVDKARSRELGGTGLGLSIAKEIMEAHGGRINASSELGRGTTMMLRFPKDFVSDKNNASLQEGI